MIAYVHVHAYLCNAIVMHSTVTVAATPEERDGADSYPFPKKEEEEEVSVCGLKSGTKMTTTLTILIPRPLPRIIALFFFLSYRFLQLILSHQPCKFKLYSDTFSRGPVFMPTTKRNQQNKHGLTCTMHNGYDCAYWQS